MCGFPVYSDRQRTIILWFNNSVQEGDGTILLVVLYCKPNGRINTVYVLPRKVTVHPRPTVRHQAVFLLWQLLTFLLEKEAILSRELLTFPQGKITSLPRLLLSFHVVREIAHLSPLALPMQGKAIILPGQQGKVIGALRHRPTQSSQAASTTSLEGTPTSTHPSRPTQGSSNEEPNPKWVINLYNKPLTPAQRSVLAKGPNFVVTPRQLPNLEYITAIEAACTKLSQQDAEELRANINRVLRSSHPPNPT